MKSSLEDTPGKGLLSDNSMGFYQGLSTNPALLVMKATSRHFVNSLRIFFSLTFSCLPSACLGFNQSQAFSLLTYSFNLFIQRTLAEHLLRANLGSRTDA